MTTSNELPSDDEAEITAAIREAIRKSRGYAAFFGWAPNRDLEEQSVLISLAESLNAGALLFFSAIAIRGRGNDPPDLEALDVDGDRLALEVTELVDGRAIQAFKHGNQYDWAEWSKETFLNSLGRLLRSKHDRFPKLKGGPYPGGYVVVVFTDEPGLPSDAVAEFLRGESFSGLGDIDRAFLLLSYDPRIERCPYFELAITG